MIAAPSMETLLEAARKLQDPKAYPQPDTLEEALELSKRDRKEEDEFFHKVYKPFGEQALEL